ncbi:hypothetical protein FN846DRAFT_925979 [Sphaerosporella brunnea]|uniref:Uncharacterized protein n=1 Tax=Sphaerosporella brunnea TaxID=1250544 RepID=A0A5J5FBZ0_9PEZI|nr:hypothetical protein FN846DRAFT_925979 [Sphaerosporella brunnea]
MLTCYRINMSSGSFSQRSSPSFLEDDADSGSVPSPSIPSGPIPPTATSTRTPLSSATIPPGFLAENPWDPYHNVMDTRDAVYGWGAGGERPGAPDPNYKRYHWIDYSGNNTSGHWESMTKVGFRRYQNGLAKKGKFPKAEGTDPIPGKTPFSKNNRSLKINCSLVDVFGKTTSFDKENTICREFSQPFPEVKDACLAVEMSLTGPRNAPSSGSEVWSGQLVAFAAHLRAYQPDWKKASEC